MEILTKKFGVTEQDGGFVGWIQNGGQGREVFANAGLIVALLF
jgi:hypothetical protein